MGSSVISKEYETVNNFYNIQNYYNQNSNQCNINNQFSPRESISNKYGASINFSANNMNVQNSPTLHTLNNEYSIQKSKSNVKPSSLQAKLIEYKRYGRTMESQFFSNNPNYNNIRANASANL